MSCWLQTLVRSGSIWVDLARSRAISRLIPAQLVEGRVQLGAGARTGESRGQLARHAARPAHALRHGVDRVDQSEQRDAFQKKKPVRRTVQRRHRAQRRAVSRRRHLGYLSAVSRRSLGYLSAASLYLGCLSAVSRRRRPARTRPPPASRRRGAGRPPPAEIWGDMGRYAEMWGDMRRYGRLASDISPHLPIPPHASPHLPTSPHLSGAWPTERVESYSLPPSVMATKALKALASARSPQSSFRSAAPARPRYGEI